MRKRFSLRIATFAADKTLFRMKLYRFLLPALLVASCCGGNKAAQEDGQRLFVGDDYAVTQTQYGKVQGYILDGVYTYLGIPYGAPTGGENRFMPPQKPESWEGIRPAMFYGNDAPQNMADKWKNNAGTFTDHWNYFDVSARSARSWCGCTAAASPPATASSRTATTARTSPAQETSCS